MEEAPTDLYSDGWGPFIGVEIWRGCWHRDRFLHERTSLAIAADSSNPILRDLQHRHLNGAIVFMAA